MFNLSNVPLSLLRLVPPMEEQSDSETQNIRDLVEKILNFQSDKRRATYSLRGRFVENPNVTFLDFMEEQLWKGWNEPTWQNDLANYRHAISSLMEKVVTIYCAPYKNVLEIGSGIFPLVHDLLNFPEKIKKQFDISDVSPYTVEHLKHKHPYSRVFELDMLKLKTQCGTENYDVILMRDVLSVLSNKSLDQGLSEVYAALKPGGYMIHFQFREPFEAQATGKYTNADTIIFPGANETAERKEIRIVDKNEFLQRLEILSNQDPAKAPLSRYYNMLPAEREEFCSILLVDDPNKKNRMALKGLTEALEKLECQNVQTINLNDDYVAGVMDSLTKAGFKIIQNETIKTSVIHRRTAEHDDHIASYFKLERGARESGYMGVLGINMVQETAAAHVFVACKPKIRP